MNSCLLEFLCVTWPASPRTMQHRITAARSFEAQYAITDKGCWSGIPKGPHGLGLLKATIK